MPALPIALTIIFLCCILPGTARAAMRSMGDGELSAVIGRAGVSIDVDLAARISVDSFRISDSNTTPNWLEFKGVTIDNGSGGPFLVKTADASFNITPITFDVSTDAPGRTTLTIVDASRTYPRYYNVGELIFAGQELGGLQIGPVTEGPSTLRLSAPAIGSGMEFDYSTRVDIGSFKYAYNSTDALRLSGVHIFGSATGAPEDPASWQMTGNFKIGDLTSATPNPASIVVGAETGNVPSTYINLPMQGSVRVEDLSFGATSFGPMAIDGINVHRLQMRFTP